MRHILANQINSSRFSINFEEFASEFLENPEEVSHNIMTGNTLFCSWRFETIKDIARQVVAFASELLENVYYVLLIASGS